MTKAYSLTEHFHDVVVIGAGGAGLRATFGMAAESLLAVLKRHFLDITSTGV